VITAEGLAAILATEEGRCAEQLADELYDLRADPHQRVDLSKERPEVLARLRELSARRLAQAIRDGDAGASAATLQALGHLGYASQLEREQERAELAARPTAELVGELSLGLPCARRLMLVEVLAARELDPAATEALRAHRQRETSRAVGEVVDRILAR
jgi:hypothetical protein